MIIHINVWIKAMTINTNDKLFIYILIYVYKIYIYTHLVYVHNICLSEMFHKGCWMKEGSLVLSEGPSMWSFNERFVC